MHKAATSVVLPQAQRDAAKRKPLACDSEGLTDHTIKHSRRIESPGVRNRQAARARSTIPAVRLFASSAICIDFSAILRAHWRKLSILSRSNSL